MQSYNEPIMSQGPQTIGGSMQSLSGACMCRRDDTEDIKSGRKMIYENCLKHRGGECGVNLAPDSLTNPGHIACIQKQDLIKSIVSFTYLLLVL